MPRRKTSDPVQDNDARREQLGDIFGFRFLTVEDIRQKLQVHRRSIVEDIQTGKLLAYRTGKLYLVKEHDAMQYLKSLLLIPESEEKPVIPMPTPITPPQRFEDIIFVTVDDVVALLHRRKPSVMQDIDSGRLRSYRMHREYRIMLHDAVAYVESFKVVPGEPQEEEE